MPSPNSHGRGRGSPSATAEKNRKGKMAEKALSFHTGSSLDGKDGGEPSLLPRPRTVPELLSSSSSSSGKKPMERSTSNWELQPAKLTKLLLNVTIQRSLGPVQVLMPPESTVEDLIAVALRQYSKEARRPVLPSNEPSGYDLHYSQFSLESLDREEELMTLGSRNFFLCRRNSETDSAATTSSDSSCSKQAEKAAQSNIFGLPWLKFMDFMR